jgi:Subtilase family
VVEQSDKLVNNTAMNRRHARATAMTCILVTSSSALALGPDVARINGNQARTLFGDGTGITVGVLDSGINFNHPYLGAGRMVAEQNFVTSEPLNTGADVFGHGTWVASTLGSSDATLKGVASGSSIINARVLDSNNSFSTDAWVVNGLGFAVDNDADIINMSLAYSSVTNNGSLWLSRATDYLTFNRGIQVVVSAGNNGNSGQPNVRGPADGFNVIGAAATRSTYDSIASFSNYGPTLDGRVRPNLAAPGQTIEVANHTYTPTNGQPLTTFVTGTSFAAPNITGILTSQIGYGRANGLSTDPKVLRATSFNSAEKVNNFPTTPWSHTSASNSGGVQTVDIPMDFRAGSGQIDGLALFNQYSPGEQGPGNVAPRAWDLHSIASGGSIDYNLGALQPGTALTTTLTWDRHVGWIDGAFGSADGVINQTDDFNVLNVLSNLNLQVFRNGSLIAQSISTTDNIEHLWLTNLLAGDYLIRVTRLAVAASGGLNPVAGSEPFALAWSSTAVPEPTTLALLAGAGVMLLRRKR